MHATYHSTGHSAHFSRPTLTFNAGLHCDDQIKLQICFSKIYYSKKGKWANQKTLAFCQASKYSLDGSLGFVVDAVVGALWVRLGILICPFLFIYLFIHSP